MDSVVLFFLAAQALLIAAAVAVALGRGRTIEAIARQLREETGDQPVLSDGDAIVDAVAHLRRRARAAEFSLDQRLRDLAYLADLIGVGIVRLTDDLRIEIANSAAHVYLQRGAGSLIGRTAIEGFGDHRLETVARDAVEHGSAASEVTLHDPDGPTLVVRARRSPILGVWLVLEDVAELRRLQRIRAEFIDNLSHELRTPITTIGLLAETLARDAEGVGDAIPEKMRERIGKLEVETGTIAQMVSELLDLARIESGGQQLHLDEVALGRLADATVERLRPFAERQHVILETDVPADLPPVSGEASQLGQVFTNLIHNALKFSPPNSTVRVALRVNGNRLEATVADQGIGIAPADLPRIFERFFKADRSRAAGGGTGLGLAIARHIVEGHGGQLSVRSEEHLGTTFMMSLPIADPARAGLIQGA